MALDSRVQFPHARTFLLKLHIDADPAQAHFIGRIEHLTSGAQYAFASLEELIALLARSCGRPKAPLKP